ncbi:MAG: hypothetical protein J4F42_11050, partial [Desulfurellaceae bacterium]|nr:hypothetical protein [Desulfurellaceae bacterium]
YSWTGWSYARFWTVLRLREETRVERRSCLNDLTLPVIADTSVVINLNASGCTEAILDASLNRFLVVINPPYFPAAWARG